jgi:hypothetical protein
LIIKTADRHAIVERNMNVVLLEHIRFRTNEFVQKTRNNEEANSDKNHTVDGEQ